MPDTLDQVGEPSFIGLQTPDFPGLAHHPVVERGKQYPAMGFGP